ncbi:MAG: ATP-binding protein [Cryomorphaceae bacterium]|nr:MAG: ATP-binding protein [Cryomorphaceae bacterium]
MSDKLSDSVLRELIKLNAQNRVIKREGLQVEFKRVFDWNNNESRAKYVKSIASFANRGGGYMIFGVKNSPKEIEGIDESFSAIDDANISAYLNNYLAPSVDYERSEIEVDNGVKVGFLYVFEAVRKPVVCIKDYGIILSESTIYYRYNSRSERIKSSDLINLLDEVKQRESEKWSELFSKIAKFGVDSSAIYSTDLGQISTLNGNKFILDERLLRRLQVIDQYSSNEVDGAPAVKIVGEIDEAGTVITRSRYLYDVDFMCDYLNGVNVSEPEEYLKALCYQQAAILPVYYYLDKANLSVDEGIDLLNGVNKNSWVKNKIINRLRDDSRLRQGRQFKTISAQTAAGNVRRRYHERLTNSLNIDDLNSEGKAKRLLEAVINLDVDTYDKNFVHTILVGLIDQFYSVRQLNALMREAVSYLDLIENRPQ